MESGESTQGAPAASARQISSLGTRCFLIVLPSRSATYRTLPCKAPGLLVSARLPAEEGMLKEILGHSRFGTVERHQKLILTIRADRVVCTTLFRLPAFSTTWIRY
jgi:hypothetical protein